MNIGDVASASGISAKMIRHYESIGVIPRPSRSDAGYRRYQPADVQRLSFVRHARDCGFSTDEIRQLLSLWQDGKRSSRDVKRLAKDHLAQIEARVNELRLIADSLSHLVAHCHGDDRPECPILDALASNEGGNGKRARARGPAPRRRSRRPALG